MAVQNFPDLGTNVEITLTNGSSFTGYWDGLQWWIGVADEPNDVPIVNSFVDRWQPAN